MTNQYSQEQVDEIGVFMANKLNESNQALKDFLQEQINNLVPVAPEPPETGEPVVPPATGGAGMFLDDGREIKQKLIEVFDTGVSDLQISHGLAVGSILSVNLLVKNKYAPVFYPAYQQDPISSASAAQFDYSWSVTQNHVKVKLHDQAGTALSGSSVKCLITYLA